jgi:hypothetical protein
MAKIHIADLNMAIYAPLSDEEGFLKELDADEASLTYGGAVVLLAVLGIVGTFGAFGYSVGADHRNQNENQNEQGGRRGGGGRF